ncbi:MAG: hypothetical protein ABI680_05380, partial [Chthoniobacteraceae bacterium]
MESFLRANDTDIPGETNNFSLLRAVRLLADQNLVLDPSYMTALILSDKFHRWWLSPCHRTTKLIALLLVITTGFDAQADPVSTPRLADATDLEAMETLDNDMLETIARARPETPEELREVAGAWHEKHAAQIQQLQARFTARAGSLSAANIARPYIARPIPKDATPAARELAQLENSLFAEFVAVRQTAERGDAMKLREKLIEWEALRAREHERLALLQAQVRLEKAATQEDPLIEFSAPPNASPEERAFLLEEIEIMADKLNITRDPSLTAEERREA